MSTPVIEWSEWDSSGCSIAEVDGCEFIIERQAYAGTPEGYDYTLYADGQVVCWPGADRARVFRALREPRSYVLGLLGGHEPAYSAQRQNLVYPDPVVKAPVKESDPWADF